MERPGPALGHGGRAVWRGCRPDLGVLLYAQRLPPGGDRQDYLSPCACGDDCDQRVDHDASRIADLVGAAASCVRIGRKGGWSCGYDFHSGRAFHWRGLGHADLGHVVGLGSAPDILPDLVPVLPWLSRALGSDRGPGYGCGPDQRAVHCRVGFCGVVPVCCVFLEPGFAPGHVDPGGHRGEVGVGCLLCAARAFNGVFHLTFRRACFASDTYGSAGAAAQDIGAARKDEPCLIWENTRFTCCQPTADL